MDIFLDDSLERKEYNEGPLSSVQFGGYMIGLFIIILLLLDPEIVDAIVISQYAWFYVCLILFDTLCILFRRKK